MGRRAWQRLTHPDGNGDGGFSLAEVLVALLLMTGSVVAMLGMITRSLETHRAQRDSAAAERMATQYIETARNVSFTDLPKQVGTVIGAPTGNGTAFTPTTMIQPCSPTDAADTCTTPTGTTPTDYHVHVQIRWKEAGQDKHFDLTTGVTDGGTATLANAGATTLSGLTGAAGKGVSVAVTSLALSPSSATVNAAGHPSQPVTVTATVTGLTSGTSFPVTWSDDSGSHQATMAGAGSNAAGQSTWSATVPAANITRQLPAGQQAGVVFAATVPGTQGVPTSSLSLAPPAAPTMTCASPAAITLSPLTVKALAAVPLSCTTTSLSSGDVVMVTWQTTGGMASGRLASSDGNSWALTLPAGTPLRSPPSESFTFTATRAGDNAAVSVTNVSTLA